MVEIKSRGISYYIHPMLKELLDGFKYAISKKNTSVVMLFDGRSGMGKTTLANQVGMYLDNNYDIDKIYYEPERFLEGLAEAKKGDFILFDEAMIISNRSAMSKINMMIVQAMSMIRSKNIYVGFCVNSIFDLDRNLVLSRADLLLHVHGENLIDRGNFKAYFKPRKAYNKIITLYFEGKKYYSYNTIPNFFGKFYNKFIVDEEEYEKRKQKGINNFLRSLESTHIKKHILVTARLCRFIKQNNTFTAEEISDIAGVSPRTIFRYLLALKKQEEADKQGFSEKEGY